MCRRNQLNSILVLVCAMCATTASAQVIEWIPVSSTGSSTITGNEINLPAGGVQVQFDLYLSGWGDMPDGVLCSDNANCAGGTCTGWDPLLCP